MNSFIKNLISFVAVAIIFTGCFFKNDVDKRPNLEYDIIHHKVNDNRIYHNLNSAINSLSNQLFINNINSDLRKRIVITTFINNERLEDTSTYGRVLSESLINDLHIKNLRIIDLTAKKDLSINQNGIFYLSRDLSKLKNKEGDIIVLVGTYSLFDYDSVVINARLIDYDTSEVLSTGRVVHSITDCKLTNLCKDEKIKVVKD